MTADEMFKNLKYKKLFEDKEEIAYKICNLSEEFFGYIIINKIDKEFLIGTEGTNDSSDEGIVISLNELKAINKKVEELGW